jgi:hypothetical protein
MLAVKVTLVPAQMMLSASLELMVMVGVTKALTVLVIPVEVAVVGLAQVAFEVNTQVTTSLFARVVVVKVAAVAVLTLLPLIFHWYAGVVPPLVMLAVKVTLAPAQMVLSASLELMVMVGVTKALTVLVMPVEVAVVGLAQVALEVNTQVTISLWASVVVVKVAAVAVLTLLPLILHWYAGVVPPLVMFAVKVTLVPAQMLLSASLELMDMVGVTVGFTVKVVVAVALHPVPLLITQV